jgi:hypothetical protein
MNPRKSEIAVFADWLQSFETTLIDAIEDRIAPFIEAHGGEMDTKTAESLVAAMVTIGDLRCELHDIRFNNLRRLIKRPLVTLKQAA